MTGQTSRTTGRSHDEHGAPGMLRRAVAVAAIAIAMMTVASIRGNAGQTETPELRIVVLEGERSVNIIEQGTAIPALIEVRDRNDLPVSGASILFLLGDGGTATLNTGLQQFATTTNALGQAAVSINPIASGAVELTVNATFQGQSTTATIAQTNFATAAQGAAASGGTSGSAGGGAAASSGLSTGAITGIAAAAAGAATAAGVAVSGDDERPGGGPGGNRNGNTENGADDEEDDEDDEPPVTGSAPSAPSAPTLQAGNGELRVSWQAPANSGPAIDDYDVRYRTTEGVWTKLPDAVRSTATVARIHGLRNGSTYEVQVRAGNAAGDGPWSESAEGTPSTRDEARVRRNRAALIALYNATDGDNWVDNKNWKSNKPLGEWAGVTTGASGLVERLFLGRNGLKGPIPSDLGELTRLNWAVLSYNQLSGKIPETLGRRGMLHNLFLSHNYLTGPIPARLCHHRWSINPQKDRAGNEVLLECASSKSTMDERAGLSIADGRGQEGSGEAISFAVTLDHPPIKEVTVDYSTRSGSGQAGEDYTPTSGTLRFATGETSKTIEVHLLDDGHEEGEETFSVALSNAVGANLEDAEATGTIDNADPLPSALIARFGRASAEHVLDQVTDRMTQRRRRTSGTRLAAAELEGLTRHDVRRPGAGWEGAEDGLGGNRYAADGIDLLAGAGFELNQARDDDVFSLWSRSARSTFGGRDGPLTLNGDVRTTMVGADYSRGRLTAGVSLARSHGTGGYGSKDRGRVEATATGLYPWLGYRVNDRVSIWGVTGRGAGALRLAPERGAATRSTLSTAMAAAGTRGEILDPGQAGGLRLAFKADALWVGTSIAGAEHAAGNLAAAEATVTRVRTAIEASQQLAIRGRVALTPSVEIGFRQDGGDAETGTGIDVAGGLAVADPSTGLSASVQVRTLIAHQAEGFTDRGVSVSVGWDPTPASPLGLSARITPSWGEDDTAALWSADGLPRIRTHEREGTGRTDAEISYGLPVGRSLVGTPRISWSTSTYGRAYRLGYSVRPLEAGAKTLEIGVDTERRRDTASGRTGTGVLGRASVRW